MPASAIQRSLLSVVALAAVVSCGSEDPTPPRPGEGGPVGSSTPTIGAVQPSSIAATNTAQTISIVGTGFAAPTVAISSPGGAEQQFTGPQLSSATATSLSVNAVFDIAGTWRAQVKNGDGKSSASFAFTVLPAAPPVVQSVKLERTADGQIFAATVTGSGFQNGLSVLLLDKGAMAGTAPLASNVAVTATSFTFSVSFPSSLVYQFHVVNPDGQMTATPGVLDGGTRLTNPTVTSYTPSTIGASTLGQLMTITGSGFQTQLGIAFTAPDGRTVVAEHIFHTSTSVRLFVKLDVPGTWTMKIIHFDGTFVETPVVVGPPDPNRAPAPAIASVSPTTFVASAAEQIVTITGTGFEQGLTVLFPENTGAFSSRVLSVTPTTVQVAATLGRSNAYVGWSVRVRNPDYVTSNSVRFTVTAPPASTTALFSATPVTVTTSLAEQRVILTGTGFSEDIFAFVTPPAADLNAAPASASGFGVSPTQLQINAVFDRAGPWRVRVGNFGVSSNTVDIVAVYPDTPAPAISSLDPAPYARSGRQFVRMLGTNFKPGLRVLAVFDDSTRQWSTDSDVDSITPTSLRLNFDLFRTGRLQVQNADGRVSNVYRFSHQAALPLVSTAVGPFIASPTPRAIQAFAQYVQPGATWTLTSPNGAQQTIAGVTFTSTPLNVAFSAVLDVTGTWRVRVKNPDGKESNDMVIRVYNAPPPTVTTTNPETPQVAHTPQTLTILGTGFQPGATVTLSRPGISGLPALKFVDSQISNLSATSLQVSGTLFPAGAWSGTIANPDGQSAQFTVRVVGTVTAPVLTGIGPTPLVKGTQRLWTVAGANFHPGMNVTLTAPDGNATTLQFWAFNVTASSFQIYQSFGQSGTWKLAVTAADGQVSNAITFTVP